MGRRLLRYVLIAISTVVLFSLGACSPFYVVRAGWEEATILWNRRDIDELVASGSIDSRLKSKLSLVTEARDFARELGLKADGSYTKYSAIDRDVLVWVLSAAKPDELAPRTWWFPIVGSVPYLGFFSREEGKKTADQLKADGYDVYLRPGAAFSTLGWFEDPLLSTMVAYDDATLVDTVIHEILHATVWIRGSVDFNESLANFVGARGAEEFFSSKYGKESPQAALCRDRWHDELVFSDFLAQTSNDLRVLFDEKKAGRKTRDEVLAERKALYKDAERRWAEADVRLPGYRELARGMNNAVLLAHRTYLTKPRLFQRLYEICDSSLVRFVSAASILRSVVRHSDKDPYEELEELLEGCGEGSGVCKARRLCIAKGNAASGTIANETIANETGAKDN